MAKSVKKKLNPPQQQNRPGSEKNMTPPPLIASSFKSQKVAKHGSKAPMERAGQPVEVAPCYLFLATEGSTYMSGQFLHPNGGEIING